MGEVYRFPNGVQSENGHLIWKLCGVKAREYTNAASAVEDIPMNVQKALLAALCTPDLTDLQNEGNWTEYYRRCDAPADGERFQDVKQ